MEVSIKKEVSSVVIPLEIGLVFHGSGSVRPLTRHSLSFVSCSRLTAANDRNRGRGQARARAGVRRHRKIFHASYSPGPSPHS